MKNYFKKLLAAVCCVCLCAGYLASCTPITPPQTDTSVSPGDVESNTGDNTEEKNDETPDVEPEVPSEPELDVLGLLGKGWNLGNALDSVAYTKGREPQFYETYWGNPVTTHEVIDTVKQSGFTAVRVPVTWRDNMDDNCNIDPAWMERVKQVVDYAMDNDLVCIINIHHDTGEKGWIKADTKKSAELNNAIAVMWGQIADFFKDYDMRLVFEGYNELLNSRNDWNGGSAEEFDLANSLNQVFVDTVRNSGGNNDRRWLIVNTYAASATERCIEGFKLPTDTAENRIIAGVHFYNTDNGEIDRMFERLNTYFISKGTPVIMGEFGRMVYDGDKNRCSYARHFTQKAREYGVGYLWWDDGGNYKMLDRNSCKWGSDELVRILTDQDYEQ